MPGPETQALEKARETPAGSDKPVGGAVATCPKKPCHSDCPKKPTKSEYKEIRKKTPSDDIRELMNNGRKACAVCGNVVATLAADHIVPLHLISQISGFACLKKEDQLEVANYPRNFSGLCTSCNSSKCAKNWHQWKGLKAWGGIKEKEEAFSRARDSARKRTNEILKELKAKIRDKDCKK